MTREEAQIIIGNIPISPNVLDDCYSIAEYQEAKTMAIEALEQKPKMGHWIPMGLVDANDNRNYECSECHHGDTHAKSQIVPYCWYCGAKMAEGV